MKKKNKIQLIVSLVLLVFVGIYLLLLWLLEDFILSGMNGLLPFFTWFFGLTLGPMIPGILYKGGKGYSKIFGDHLFKTKEKGFLFFFLDLILGAVIIIVSLFGINLLLPLILRYIVIIFFFWILLFYLWFNRYKSYNFPHYYFWISLVILIGGGLITYFFI